MCKLCNKNYVGRTTRFLRQRVNEHRAMYYKLLNDPQADLLNPNDHDGYSLGRHLIDDHCCRDKNDFKGGGGLKNVDHSGSTWKHNNF